MYILDMLTIIAKLIKTMVNPGKENENETANEKIAVAWPDGKE
jgi:hypothetical protein